MSGCCRRDSMVCNLWDEVVAEFPKFLLGLCDLYLFQTKICEFSGLNKKINTPFYTSKISTRI